MILPCRSLIRHFLLWEDDCLTNVLLHFHQVIAPWWILQAAVHWASMTHFCLCQSIANIWSQQRVTERGCRRSAVLTWNIGWHLNENIQSKNTITIVDNTQCFSKLNVLQLVFRSTLTSSRPPYSRFTAIGRPSCSGDIYIYIYIPTYTWFCTFAYRRHARVIKAEADHL